MPGTAGLAHIGFVFALVAAPHVAAADERLVQTTTETRTVIHLKAPADSVRQALPPGWTSNVGKGALEGANVSINLIDGIAQSDAEGKAAAFPDKYAVVVVPAKNAETGATAFFVVGGAVAPGENAPGAYAAYEPGTVTMTKSLRADGVTPALVDESWDVATPGGDRLHFAASFPRGVGTRVHAEPVVYSGPRPDFFRRYKADFVSEIVHSAGPDGRRAKALDFTASGPHLTPLLGANPEVVAVTSIPAYTRQIFVPGPEITAAR